MIRQSVDVGERLRVWTAIVIVGMLGTGIGLMTALTHESNPTALRVALHALIGGLGSGLLVYVVVSIASYLGETGAVAFTQGTGYEPPRNPSWSPIEAMQVAGDDEAASAWYERTMLEWPDHPQLLMRGASFHQSLGNFAKARDLLRTVQRTCGDDAAADVQASYQLMDLYDGPLEEPARVLSELRRLADRYPDTRISERALETITRRKDDAKDEADPRPASAEPRQPM